MNNLLYPDLTDEVRSRAQRVRLAAFDVDGTLTDGHLLYTEDGHEIKAFQAHDGLGLKRLQHYGIEVAIITARVSHALALRAGELGITHLYQGRDRKRDCLADIAAALHLSLEECAMIGDDLPDLAAMRAAGLAVAVANAHPWVKAAAHWQTSHHGGNGAAREVCDLLLEVQGFSQLEWDHWC